MGTYRVDPIRASEIPKRGGGARRMAELSGRDARLWHDLAGRVARVLEPCLDPRVLASRAGLTNGGWRPAPLGPALRTAREAAVRLARRGTLLRTDVEAFYPSVAPSVLHGALLGIGADPEDARLAADLLEGWGSEGYAGLPVGPPGSAVLAAAVLRPVDGALGGLPFLRWVDDYLVRPRSDRDLVRVLDLLDEALGALGLTRSDRKTGILEGTPRLRWPAEGSGPGRR